MAQRVKSLPAMWETRFDPWVGKIPWRRKWQPTPVFLLGKSHGQRSLAGDSPWGYKESDTTEWLQCTAVWLVIHLLKYIFTDLILQMMKLKLRSSNLSKFTCISHVKSETKAYNLNQWSLEDWLFTLLGMYKMVIYTIRDFYKTVTVCLPLLHRIALSSNWIYWLYSLI